MIIEKTASWKELLLDLNQRGLSKAPQLAVGDSVSGFRAAPCLGLAPFRLLGGFAENTMEDQTVVLLAEFSVAQTAWGLLFAKGKVCLWLNVIVSPLYMKLQGGIITRNESPWIN